MDIVKEIFKHPSAITLIENATLWAIKNKFPVIQDHFLYQIPPLFAIWSCTALKDHNEIRLAFSIISGLLISDVRFHPRADSKIDLLKTAGVVASIYYALTLSSEQAPKTFKSVHTQTI